MSTKLQNVMAYEESNVMAYEESFDVMLVVQGHSFMVHKFALVAASPVFATMFEYDTPENKTGLVNIDDCDVDTFVTFLEYLYTGTMTEDISFDDALQLYHTAHKYDVHGLKQSCLQTLRGKITTRNVTEAAELARQYNEPGLMSYVKDFFANNFGNILSTNLKEMMSRTKTFDVIVVVEGELFMANQCVLAAGSPVFAATFKHNMSESQTKILQFDDCNIKTFLTFMKYLYLGTLAEDISFDDTLQLYRIAHKYVVWGLKQLCLQSLRKNMTVQNLTKALDLARQYQESELTSYAMSFFNKNFNEFQRTWKT